MLLTGSYRRTLDDKHRLAIPTPLREQLPAGEPLYLSPGLDGCVAIYPRVAFASLTDRLAALSPAARKIRDYSRLFYSQAASVKPDAQRRFRTTPELTKWAKFATEVSVSACATISNCGPPRHGISMWLAATLNTTSSRNWHLPASVTAIPRGNDRC